MTLNADICYNGEGYWSYNEHGVNKVTLDILILELGRLTLLVNSLYGSSIPELYKV